MVARQIRMENRTLESDYLNISMDSRIAALWTAVETDQHKQRRMVLSISQMNMTSLQAIWSFVYTVFYYLLLPIIVIVKWLLITLGFIVAPLLHLAHYILYACLWPLRILAKFEVCLSVFLNPD